ncbi:MAG: hypothetical protein WBG46_00035 [Nonlabens sp.]
MKTWIALLFILSSFAVCGQSAFATVAERSRSEAEQLFQQKEYTKAQVAFEKIHNSKPSDLKVIERLGDVQGHLGNFEIAALWYEKLTEKKPQNADYHFKLGAALALQAQNASKIKAVFLLGSIKKHLKKAARLDLDHINSRHALSQLYAQLPGILGGSIAKSKDYAAALLKISKIDGYYAYGYIHNYEEEYLEAEKWYEKAVKLGGSITAYTKLAELQENKIKDKDAALKTYTMALFKFPQNSYFKKAVKRLSES